MARFLHPLYAEVEAAHWRFRLVLGFNEGLSKKMTRPAPRKLMIADARKTESHSDRQGVAHANPHWS